MMYQLPPTASKLTRAKQEEALQISFLTDGKQEKVSPWPKKKK